MLKLKRTTETYANDSHQEKFDLLRGACALLVLVDHTYAVYVGRLLGGSHFLTRLMSFIGTHAVLIFFLLSGYLITQSCVVNIQRNGFFDPREYLISRLTRIYPPLIGSILVVISIWIFLHSFGLPGVNNMPIGMPEDAFVVRRFFSVQLGDVIDALIMNGGLLNENGALWSLYIEFRIYVIVFFLAYGVAGQKNFWRIISLVIGIAIAIYSNRFSNDSYHETYYFVWLLGAVAYLFQPRVGS